MLSLTLTAAILTITTDRFVVITSNTFAVLGLRTLFWVITSAAIIVFRVHGTVSVSEVFCGSAGTCRVRQSIRLHSAHLGLHAHSRRQKF